MKSKFGSGEKRQYQNLLNKEQFKKNKINSSAEMDNTVKPEEKGVEKEVKKDDSKDSSKKDKSNNIVKKLEQAIE